MSAKKVNLTPMPQDEAEIDQDKLREEHLEAGRQEIMKALEGVPGAEKVAELMERGRKKGKLSSAELMEALEDLELEGEQLDKLYDTFESLGIDTAGEYYNELEPLAELEDLADLDQDAPPPAEELEEIPPEEMVDPNALGDTFGIDDPVRMYLKEIGKVNLLSSEEEVALAQAMSAGSAAEEQLKELKDELSDEDAAALKKLVKEGDEAKQRLAEANLRLVVSIAKRYVGRGMHFLDLIQ